MSTTQHTPAIPDEDGVFTVQVPDGPQEFCLVRPFSASDIPKPPPLSTRQQLKRKLYRFRNAYYSRKLDGTTGTLKNGVTWRLDALPPEKAIGLFTGYMTLRFDDPRCGGLQSGGFDFIDRDFEYEYRDALHEHARKLKLRNLLPAEPGDPDGFFVKWDR